MRIAVIGSGYAGTTLAAGLADLGHEVTAIDIDESIVETINAGESPIYEPGLDELISKTIGNTLAASTEYGSIADAGLIFIAVQTPTAADGSIDTRAIETATRDAVQTLKKESKRDDGHVIVIKSTVTPPQIAALRDVIREQSAGSDVHVELATNPEFLREGSAVEDFQHPDKIVFGTDSSLAATRLAAAFEPIVAANEPAVIVTDPETAAMIKYANNAFLAAKISLINDLGNICKEFGIDAYDVAEAIGTDARISEEFLRSGVGFGGSCFPKDVRAIIAAADAAGYDSPMLRASLAVNDEQPNRMIALLERHIEPPGRRIAVLGLAFKPGTDDIRNSRAIPIIEALRNRDAEIVAYDPVAMGRMRERFPDLEYVESARHALAGADAALVVADWEEFASLDSEFDGMTNELVIDGRRIVTPRESMTYEGLTW